MRSSLSASSGSYFLFLVVGCLVGAAAPVIAQSYVDCGANCSNLALGKSVSASGLWNASTNPASKVNDGNTGTTSTCEGSSGYCAIAVETPPSPKVRI